MKPGRFTVGTTAMLGLAETEAIKGHAHDRLHLRTSARRKLDTLSVPQLEAAMFGSRRGDIDRDESERTVTCDLEPRTDCAIGGALGWGAARSEGRLPGVGRGHASDTWPHRLTKLHDMAW